MLNKMDAMLTLLDKEIIYKGMNCLMEKLVLLRQNNLFQLLCEKNLITHNGKKSSII